MFQASPLCLGAAVVGLVTESGCLLFASYLHTRWLLFLPLGLLVGKTPTPWSRCQPAGWAGALLSMPARIYQCSLQLLRGVGGVCRLKLRYKGKSFRWHRRRGSLILRFGYSHLVAVPF